MPFDLFQAVDSLRRDWPTLHDVDRGEQIAQILSSGMSGRTLADAVRCDEKHIRHLATADRAVPDDKAAARAGQISTRELVRRVKARDQETQAAQRKTAAEKAVQAATRAGNRILRWLEEEQISSAYGEQIVDFARQQFMDAHSRGKLPKTRAPQGMSVDEIIHRCEVQRDLKVMMVETYSKWLARWLFFALPDANGFLRALDVAWAKLIRA